MATPFRHDLEMSREDRWWRSIRWAAYGCLVLALLQAVSLPWPFGHTELGELAIPRWIGQLAFSLLFALALFNRQLWAAVLLGLYGVTRLYVIASAIVHIFDGSAFASHMGPGVLLALCIPLPFAMLWIRGAWSAIQLWRATGQNAEREQAG